MSQNDSIIIKDLWGKVLSALVIAGIIGGVSFAFAQAGNNAEMRTNIENIQATMQANDANRDEQVAEIKANVKTVMERQEIVAREQTAIGTKLDMLLERKNK